jgi:hypothetical protein
LQFFLYTVPVYIVVIVPEKATMWWPPSTSTRAMLAGMAARVIRRVNLFGTSSSSTATSADPAGRGGDHLKRAESGGCFFPDQFRIA